MNQFPSTNLICLIENLVSQQLFHHNLLALCHHKDYHCSIQTILHAKKLLQVVFSPQQQLKKRQTFKIDPTLTVSISYHVLEQKRLNINNLQIDFAEMVKAFLNILIDLWAFFPMQLFHLVYLAVSVDIQD